MKTFIYFLFLFGVFFTHPSHGLSLKSKYISPKSFEKSTQKFSFSATDFKKSFFFSGDNYFSDDDDDYLSLKKRITFVSTVPIGNHHFFIKPFSNQLRNISCYKSFSKYPLFEFISLNVLKI